MKISTKFWKSNDANQYKDKIIKIVTIYGIGTTVDSFVFGAIDNLVMCLFNLFFLLLTILIIVSYNRNQEENMKIGRNDHKIDNERMGDENETKL